MSITYSPEALAALTAATASHNTGPTATDPLLTTDETAALLLSNTNTLAFWRQRKTGPKWAKLGRRVVYRRSDVLAWIDAQFAAAEGGVA